MPTYSTVGRRLADGVRAATVTPALLGVIASPRLRERPYPIYRAIRGIDPVHHSALGVFVVSGHAECDAALRHPGLGNDETKADLSLLRIAALSKLLDRGNPTTPEPGPLFTLLPQLMLFRDPPDHTRLRRLVNRAFTPKRIEQLSDQIVKITDGLLDSVAERSEFDLMGDLAYPLPARVICELVGLPADEADMIVTHGQALATGLDPAPMRSAETIREADVAVDALRALLRIHIAKRRKDPQDDLLTGLVQAEEAGDRLSEDELIATVLLLLIAGHETTANLIGNGIDALLRDPAQTQRLVDDPDLAKTAVDELLRFDSPVQMTQRIALEPVRIGSKNIPKGAFVVVCLGAANRDPQVFQRPNKLDLSRSPNPHLSFSAGAHFCMGAALARLEAQIAIPALLTRYPELHRTRAGERHRASFTIRSFPHLHLGHRSPGERR